MQTRHGSAILLLGCLCAGWMCAPSAFGAGERCQEFLDALRSPERGYYDTALDYLESMRNSPLAGKTFQEAIEYEVGLTRFMASRMLPPAERERELEKAKDCFQNFLMEHSRHSQAIVAERHLANILVERGRLKMEAAARLGKKSRERRSLMVSAKYLFQDAQTALDSVSDKLFKKQKALGKIDLENVEAMRKRSQWQSEIMMSRFTQAKMYYEIARTHEPGSKENQDNLKKAAAKFSEYYWKYEPRLGSYPFYIEEARCHMELGNYLQALTILNELASLKPDDENFRRILMPAVKLALQIDLLPQVKKYQAAWDTFQHWEKNLQVPGDLAEEAAAIDYLGGVAALELAQITSPKTPELKKQREEYLAKAKALLSYAAKNPNEYRSNARLKLADPLLADSKTEVILPDGFADACERGKLAWDQLREVKQTPLLAARLRDEAIFCFRFALANASFDVKNDDLNTIRYCLAYLEWDAGRYYEAAVLGEFLARWFPNSKESQSGAEIALNAYAKLCGEASKSDNRQFEMEQMTQLAEYVANRWPLAHVADDAWMTMIRDAVAKQDMDRMMQCLSRIPVKSLRRADAELLAGQSLWNEYLRACSLPESKRPVRQKMNRIRSEAMTNLENGIARTRKNSAVGREVTYPLAAGSLALSQAYLDTGQAEKAIASLNDPKIGAYALVSANHKAAAFPNFRTETLKTTLLAYVATQQFAKAAGIIAVLEKTGGIRGTQIDVSLGRQFEESLKRFRADGNQTEAVKAARGFEFFLSRIASRPAAESGFNTLYWVADAFANVGIRLDRQSGKVAPEAAIYYEKAVTVFRSIIAECRANPKFATQPGAVETIQLRLARYLRRLEKYDEAVASLVPLLKTHNALLDVQREAAYTYQAWGDAEPDRLLTAIRGNRESAHAKGEPMPPIWGWSGIARRIQFSESQQEAFNEARYNLALCRMNYAMSKANREQTDLLRQAEQDILVLQRLRPDMGGKKWYDRYEELLKKIQAQLSVPEEEQGLKAAEQKFSAASK